VINANCSLVKDVEIGSDTIINYGTVLGSDGFGFAPSSKGYVKIEQLGGLKIGKNVEIGANCTIDRGAIDDTEIKDGVILDNLIHIAHNVILGENSAIAASCAIAGSTKIGKNFRMGGLSGVLGHLNICDNVSVGAHTLITKDIKESGDYVGIMPAQSHKDWAKSSVFIKKQGK
jgi:UDP-3-O-[3-hydroxymyristoyl] glucosamine N-acyltransferase